MAAISNKHFLQLQVSLTASNTYSMYIKYVLFVYFIQVKCAKHWHIGGSLEV